MKLVILTFNVLLFIPNIYAQNNEFAGKDTIAINEILVESNRLAMTKLRAPNKVQLFNEIFISSLGGNRLPDLLGCADAVFINDYGFNSGIKTISVNSTQSEHTLILLDGIRLNSRQNAQVDLSLYDISNLERVEVSKGGSSALYGSEAIGSTINLISKNSDFNDIFSLNVRSIIGSYGFRKFFGWLSHGIDLGGNKAFAYSLSGSDERAENSYDYYYSGGTEQVKKKRENSNYDSQELNLNAKYQFSKQTSLRLYTYYSHFERGVPGIELGYPAGTARQIDYNSISSVSFNSIISKKLSFKTDLNYKYSLQKYYDTATYNLSVKINSFYKLNSYTNTTYFNYLAAENSGLETGYEISYNNISSNETKAGRLVQGALFATASYGVKSETIPDITFYPSIRYDYFSNIELKHVITGKLGINIKPKSEVDLSFKSTIGNNFRAPTFNELYWIEFGNENLKPERSVSFDAGVFYRSNMIFLNEVEFSYYNITTTDRVIWTPITGTIWRPVNVGKVKSEGIDISLSPLIASSKRFHVLLKLNYTYGTAKKKNEDFPGDPSYNRQLIYLPKEMIKSTFMFNYLPTSKFVKYVSFNLFYNYTGRRYTDFENTRFVSRFDILDGNAGIGINLLDTEIAFKFIINNILSENYQVVYGYPMPLRNYKFEISFKY